MRGLALGFLLGVAAAALLHQHAIDRLTTSLQVQRACKADRARL